MRDLPSTFNKHFGSITDSLNLFSWPEDTSMSSENDTINSIIKKFAFHQSIKAVKKKFKSKSEFSFNHVSTESTKRIINDLDIKKPSGEIPTWFFKKCDFVLNTITVCVNEALKMGCFRNSLNLQMLDHYAKKVDPSGLSLRNMTTSNKKLVSVTIRARKFWKSLA